MNSALSYIISNEKQTPRSVHSGFLLLTSHVPSECGCSSVCRGALH